MRSQKFPMGEYSRSGAYLKGAERQVAGCHAIWPDNGGLGTKLQPLEARGSGGVALSYRIFLLGFELVVSASARVGRMLCA